MNENARVLIADADEQLRALLYKALLDLDVFCDCAGSARDALNHLRQNNYALLLLQLELENVDAVVDELRTVAPDARPMVLATAEVRTPKDAVDTDLVQIIVRRPLKVGQLAALISSCLDYKPGVRG